MKTILFIALMLMFNNILFSQTNLVPNSNFQEVTKKVKEEGMINMATPWVSPTLAPADLYVSDTKSSLIGVPENAYGEEKPMEGDNYAGFLAYSYKNKEPRSYLQVKLTEPLKEGVEYCVTINVSLADLSKYACNHLGVFLSKNAVSANNTDIMLFEPQIVSRKLTVYEKQFYWVPICSTYKAEGDEEYITIGNFTPDEKLTLTKVKRPRGFTSPQTYDAYYYIDNVSVIESNEKCDCDLKPGEEMEVVKRDFASDENEDAGKFEIINTDGSVLGSKNTTTNLNTNEFVISFDPKSASIIGDATTKLDKLVEVLKSETGTGVLLKGYYDVSEKDVEKLDGQRVMAIYKYIVSKGINKDLIKRSMEGINDANKDSIQNMKVVIELIKPKTE